MLPVPGKLLRRTMLRRVVLQWAVLFRRGVLQRQLLPSGVRLLRGDDVLRGRFVLRE